MEPDHKGLLKDLYNEAVIELAELLENAAMRIEYFMRLEADLRGECMSMAMELTK